MGNNLKVSALSNAAFEHKSAVKANHTMKSSDGMAVIYAPEPYYEGTTLHFVNISRNEKMFSGLLDKTLGIVEIHNIVTQVEFEYNLGAIS